VNRDQIDKHTETVKAGLAFAFMHEPTHSKALSSLATLRALALDSVDRPDWAPIETAPKNAVGVILWFPKLPERRLGAEAIPGYYSYTAGRWIPSLYDVNPPRFGQPPTHWLPLLEGPCTPKA
jgi:hypothetical protein